MSNVQNNTIKQQLTSEIKSNQQLVAIFEAEGFNKTYITLTFGVALFSGVLVSFYVENKLERANYHFCENLSYEGIVRGSTHYVWRAKNISCN